jgi:hypothetical protein
MVDAGDMRYEFRVEGDVSERWTAWFGATQILAEGGESVITATIQDQSALHGVLSGIRDLGLCLISVQRID